MSTAAVPWQRSASATLRVADPRRALQLALAALWLVDGILQFQPYMFTPAFGRDVLAPSAAGNPSFVAAPITRVADFVTRHPAPTNAAFAATQILLALGIAWRPLLRPALAASIVWALGVWWLGEGLGGILTGGAGPLLGGPGAALLYAVLAVLVWPTGPEEVRRSVAVDRLGSRGAAGLWLALWLALAGFAVDATSRSAAGLRNAISGMSGGRPAWLAAIGNDAASVCGHHSTTVCVFVGALLALIALAVVGPPPALRLAVACALITAAAIWLFAEALGGLAGGQSTDPNSGPLLALIALAYWPGTTAARRTAAGPT
ncbi:MAG TPA: hypothetical protein VME70_09400 [Mycobacteriales bacterium]|nr:hypothetical protein [Mycobacteriales bacterium]